MLGSLAAYDAGRLFIAPIYPSTETALSEGQPENSLERACKLIDEDKLGGVLFKHYWKKEALQEAISKLKERAVYPLILCIDCESGLAMRLPEYESVPHPQRYDQAVKVGKIIGAQLKEIGLNMALAPVLDVNTNPLNPIIGKRALGSDPEIVAELGAGLIRGIQSENVMACGKHFPGHGDTHIDSHLGLPTLEHTFERLEAVELHPFKRAIDEGVVSIMTGHLVVRAYDSEPASLSKIITTDLLQTKLGFKGLVITDDLLMKAVPQKGASLAAFKAGADLILVPPNLEVEMQLVADHADQGEIDRRVNKIISYLNGRF